MLLRYMKNYLAPYTVFLSSNALETPEIQPPSPQYLFLAMSRINKLKAILFY